MIIQLHRPNGIIDFDTNSSDEEYIKYGLDPKELRINKTTEERLIELESKVSNLEKAEAKPIKL